MLIEASAADALVGRTRLLAVGRGAHDIGARAGRRDGTLGLGLRDDDELRAEPSSKRSAGMPLVERERLNATYGGRRNGSGAELLADDIRVFAQGQQVSASRM